MGNRFDAFDSEERIILRTLLQEHANTVSACGLAMEVRLSAYLLKIEALEDEASGGQE